MRRALFLALVGALLVMVGGAAARAGGEQARAMEGRCLASFQQQSFVFPILTLSLEGTCQLTHLGATTWTATQTVNLLTSGFVNETDYTAANGDTLHGTTTGTSTGNPAVVFRGTETYTSGTGRFASVGGEAEIAGGASFVTGTGFWTTLGTIAFGR